MRKFVLTVVFGLVALAVAACSGGKDKVESPCQQVVETGCTKCHSTERICEVIDNAETNWPAIVKDMGKRGKLSQEVQDKVLSCLANTAEHGKFECPK